MGLLQEFRYRLSWSLIVASTELTSADDSSDLQILEWYYNDILYNSTEAFRTALQDPSFVRLRPNLDGDWTNTVDYSSNLPEREIPPPLMIQPSGARYNIDQKENYVSWSKSLVKQSRTLLHEALRRSLQWDLSSTIQQIRSLVYHSLTSGSKASVSSTRSVANTSLSRVELTGENIAWYDGSSKPLCGIRPCSERALLS